jgi:hypothetical protein
VPLAVLVLFGCKTTTTTTTTSMEPIADAKVDIRLVSVKPPGGSNDANFDPPTIRVKKKSQIVVWVLEGEGTLDIQFANNPFPSPPICDGRFCVALKPPAQDKPTGSYPYTATVTVAGQTTSADPNVEVVD